MYLEVRLLFQQRKHEVDLITIMLRDYIKKIRSSIDDSPFLIPYSLQMFYCALASLSKSIPSSQITHRTVENFSNIYNLIKTKAKSKEDLKDPKNLYHQLSEFLLPFRKYSNGSDSSKAILKHFDNADFLEFMDQELVKCKQIVNTYAEKKNKIHVSGNNELSYIFWVTKFKADYAVHFDIFWNALLSFLSNFPYYERFINQSSKRKVKEVVDPDTKFYVNSAHSADLFKKFSEPAFLEELVYQTSLKKSQMPFISDKELSLMVRKTSPTIQTQTKIPFQSEIILSGLEVKVGEHLLNCKYPPTIRFGSLSQNEIFIKNQYISRRQFMIIEEVNGFSLVCLSPSNFTAVTYPHEVKIQVGMIFRVNSEMIQITRNQEMFGGFSEVKTEDVGENEQNDATLDYLPENKSFEMEREVEYKYLTGNRKHEKKVMNMKKCYLEFTNEHINLMVKQGDFYLPPNVQILAKTSNQVISGHLSHKVKLQKNMKVVLEGIQFLIL